MEFIYGALVGMAIGIIVTFIYYRPVVSALAKELESVKSRLKI